MEHPVLRQTSLFLFFLFLFSCTNKHENKNVYLFETVYAKDVESNSSRGIFYVNGHKFTGSIYWTYPNGIDTLRVRRYVDGKKEGQWSRYYPNNVIEDLRFYHSSQKVGEQIGYFPNGKIHFVNHFENDVYEGNAKEWNIHGLLIKDQNYKKGQEEGKQQVWYNNGKIKANYIMKEGRRYGLLGTKNCINVSNETF